jgi:hypothetical protein
MKRFYILEGNSLRCYKARPADKDWLAMSAGTKDYTETLLTADTVITVEDSRLRGQRTMTVRTPSKKIVIKVSEHQMSEIVRWYRELKRTVQQQQSSEWVLMPSITSSLSLSLEIFI